MRRGIRGCVASLTACAIWIGIAPEISASTSSVAPVGSGTRAYINLIVAFVVVLLLMVILFRLLGKRMNVQQKGTVHVIAARQLAPNRSVQVVEVGSRLYLIGVGEDVQLLADVTDSYDMLDDDVPPVPFSQMLQSAFHDLVKNRREEE